MLNLKSAVGVTITTLCKIIELLLWLFLKRISNKNPQIPYNWEHF